MHFVHIHGTFLEVVMLDPEKCTYKICIAPTKFTTVYILVYFFWIFFPIHINIFAF